MRNSMGKYNFLSNKNKQTIQYYYIKVEKYKIVD